MARSLPRDVVEALFVAKGIMLRVIGRALRADPPLEPPEAYAGGSIQSIDVIVDRPTTARVIVTMNEIPEDGGWFPDAAVRAGETIVFTGTCSAGGMTWEVGGTVAEKYRPKS